VICVKHHLQTLSDVAEGTLVGKMKDLDSIPSINFRAVIDEAKLMPNQTSNELRETLIKAGLMDKKAGNLIESDCRGSNYRLHD
jgi:hypothetical protein